MKALSLSSLAAVVIGVVIINFIWLRGFGMIQLQQVSEVQELQHKTRLLRYDVNYLSSFVQYMPYRDIVLYHEWERMKGVELW